MPISAGLCIGISGAPESTPRPGSTHAVHRCRELGIPALEMGWVRKVTLSQGAGSRLRAAAAASDVTLSAHGPYYINLNSTDPRKRAESIERIVGAGIAASWAGAGDVVLHLAFYHGDPIADVYGRVRDGLAEARERLREALGAPGGEVRLRPELMGRRSQFGDLNEILNLCAELGDGVEPCIDIAHLHARTGAVNSPVEFEGMWDAVEDALGPDALSRAYIHMSGIAYGPSGEIRHLAFADADLDYRGFLEVVHDRGVSGTVIVESPERERDVEVLTETWRRIALEVVR